MNEPMPYLGQALSLLCAITWAFAIILFKKSGEKVHPIALSLFKNLFAVVLFLPTMWIFHESLIRPVPLSEYMFFLLSGVIGIAIGDTLFFVSLNRIGAGLSAIVDCLYSPSIITLFHPSGRKIISSLFSAGSWGYTIGGSFCGTYLAMLVWLAGMKFTQASIAAALNQTSTIFLFVFASLFLHEPITPRRILAIALAVCGALLVIIG